MLKAVSSTYAWHCRGWQSRGQQQQLCQEAESKESLFNEEEVGLLSVSICQSQQDVGSGARHTWCETPSDPLLGL